jgi:hypothetical protein
VLGEYGRQHRNAPLQCVGVEPGIAENEPGGRRPGFCQISGQLAESAPSG